MKTFYAVKSPRGFSNEITVYRFESKSERDRFVDDDPEVMADKAARVITAKEAKAILRRKGDAATEVFNRMAN